MPSLVRSDLNRNGSRAGAWLFDSIPRALRPWLLGAVAIAAVALAWVIVSLRVDRAIAFDDIEEHFKYGSIGSEPGVSLLRPVGGVLPPVLGLPCAARHLPGPHPRRIRIVRLHGGAGTRAAHRHLAPPADRRRSRGHELRSLPQRYRAGHAYVFASCRARNARAQAGPAGVRPVRARVLPRQPADGRGGARAVSGQRRAFTVRARVAAGRFDRPPQAADARLEQSHLADSGRAHSAVGTGARGHVQPLQGDPVQLEHRQAALVGTDRSVRFPVVVEPGTTGGPAVALGRGQRLGGRAEPQRWPWRGHYAGHGRSRRDGPGPPMDVDLEAPALSVPGGPEPGGTRRGRLRAGVRTVPRGPPIPRWPAVGRPAGSGRGHRSHRHRSPPARFVHAGLRRQPVRALPGFAVPVQAVPEDPRLRQPSARRHLAARTLPPQRVGAHAARASRRTGAAPCVVLSRLRRVRSRRASDSCPRWHRRTAAASSSTTRPFPATATAGTSTARPSRTPTRQPSSNT